MGRAGRTSRSAKPKALTEAGFRALARKFRLLGDPMRLRILFLLRDGRASVGDLAERLECSQPTASRQLAKMADGGLLRREQEGTAVYYSVADPGVYAMCEDVCGGLERSREALFRDLG